MCSKTEQMWVVHVRTHNKYLFTHVEGMAQQKEDEEEGNKFVNVSVGIKASAQRIHIYLLPGTAATHVCWLCSSV